MKELERQRVTRIALDHALRMQEAEKAPPKCRMVYIKALVAAAAGAVATAAASSVTAVRFLH